MEEAMNFSSSTLDGELIVLRLPQEQKMLQSSRKNKLFQGSNYPDIRGFLCKKSKKFRGKKPRLGNFFWPPQSQNPTYLPGVGYKHVMLKKNSSFTPICVGNWAVHVRALCKTDQVDRCWHCSHFSPTCVRSFEGKSPTIDAMGLGAYLESGKRGGRGMPAPSPPLFP